MFYAIISLLLFSIILLIMEYQNRYCWLFVMMVLGMALSFFAMSLHLTYFGSYYYSFSPLFKLDYSFFSFVSTAFKLPLSTILRMINLGIALYLLAVPLFVYEFTNNTVHTKKKFVVLAALMLYNFCFYDPINAYFGYNSFNAATNTRLYATVITVLHQVNRVWIFAYLFYPVFILYNYFKENKIRFIRRQILLLSVSIAVINILFYSVFFLGPFMMSPHKVFITGFWIFENIQEVYNRYYLLIPLLTVFSLLATLLLLLNYRLGSLVTVFTDRKIKRNISRMNELLSDTLHSQKNLLFSISILANKSWEETNNETAKKIVELSQDSLKQTADMLDTLRNIRYQFKENNVASAIDDAVALLQCPPCIKIQMDTESDDAKNEVSRFDRYHITRVFVNLLNNAIEAIERSHREKGRISISIVRQFQWLFISIEDNGAGIAKSALKKVFEPFSGKHDGSLNWGLGLCYAYKVVKAHWGHLRLESREGEGTTVQMMLPKSKK